MLCCYNNKDFEKINTFFKKFAFFQKNKYINMINIINK